MDETTILENLSKLSEREYEILNLKCKKHLRHADIGKELYIARATVTTHFGRIYLKLGIDRIEKYRRERFLVEEICPYIDMVEDADLTEDVDESPVPEKVLAMVEEDERALMRVEPIVVDTNNRRVAEPPVARRVFLLGLLIGVALFGGVLWLLGAFDSEPQATKSDPQAVIQEVPVTVIVTSTPEPIKPTEEPAIVVVTATDIPPSETPEVIPIQPVGFIFSDDFEDGPDPNWHVLFGNLGMANGKYTIIEPFTNRHDRHLSILENHYWQNVSVTIELADFEDIFVAKSDNAKGAIIFGFTPEKESIGLFISPGDVGLQFGIMTSDGTWTPHSGSLVDGDSGDFELGDASNTIKVELVDDTFKAYVNSNLVTSATFSNLEPGLIGLWFEAGTFTEKVETYSPRIERINIESLQ